MSPLRVMAVIESSTITGPAKNLIAFAQWAAQADHGNPLVEVSIVTYVRGDNTANAFTTAAQAAGIPVELIRERRALDLNATKRLEAIFWRLKPDIVQTHNVKSHLFVRLRDFGREVPWIAFNHGYTATDFKDRLYNQADRWSLRRACLAVTVCKPFGQRLQSLGVEAKRIRVQHNSVPAFRAPTDWEMEEVRRIHGFEQARVIAVIGRLSYEKGHADLLWAISTLTGSGDALRDHIFAIVGDGPERKSLEALAKQIGIERYVRFVGHQTNIPVWLTLSEFLVLPSHSEGSPNVVLEAMAAARPVVATAVGGVPEIVVPEATGLLVPPHDEVEMARAIARLTEDEPLRSQMGRAGQERALATFSPEQYCRSIVSIYQDALRVFVRQTG